MSVHGEAPGIDMAVWLSSDPDLALVGADIDAWMAARSCECEALCECECVE